MTALKVASLFAGIRGIDLTFEQAGYEIVWSNNFGSDACETYLRNFPNTLLSKKI